MLGPTQFNTNSADPDDGRVCTLSRFTDITKQEYGQYAAGHTAAQEDLNRLEKRSNTNLEKLSKSNQRALPPQE